MRALENFQTKRAERDTKLVVKHGQHLLHRQPPALLWTKRFTLTLSLQEAPVVIQNALHLRYLLFLWNLCQRGPALDAHLRSFDCFGVSRIPKQHELKDSH